MSKELITVVTVCFNAGQTIAKTMQSVLNQTYRPLEYILVDGKSTDNTLNIIYELEPLFHEKGIAVRIVSEKDKGIFDAMNKGVKLANGRWVNFMNEILIICLKIMQDCLLFPFSTYITGTFTAKVWKYSHDVYIADTCYTPYI
ncbi:glycosyltransferase [Phocaeicola plebeius]